MIKKLASNIPILLNPLLMPTILFAILFYFTAFVGHTVTPTYMVYMLFILFTITFILPVFCIVVLKITNNISSIFIKDRKERVMPFFFISLFYMLNAYFFIAKLRLSTVFIVIFVAIAIMSVLVSIITYFWRISAQSTAICGTIGFLLAISYKYPQDKLLFPMIILILLAGVVMSSKLYLNANNPHEVLGGCILGFVVSFGSIYFFI